MSNKRIAIPRAYTDWVNWIYASGKYSVAYNVSLVSSSMDVGKIENAFDVNPVNWVELSTNGSSSFKIRIRPNVPTEDYNYIAILGHNIKTATASFRVAVDNSSTMASPSYPTMTEKYNGTVSGGWCTPASDGWTLLELSAIATSDNGYFFIEFQDDDQSGIIGGDIKIGSFMVGRYYDFKTRPNLSHKIEKQYTNRIQESLGGSRYSIKHNYAHNKWIGQFGRWSLSSEPHYSRSGRTIFNLSWSFIQDTDMFRANDGTDGQYVADSDTIENSLISKVHGSHIPFIFQLDNTDFGGSGFYLVRMTKHSMQQTAPNLWTFSCTLEEEL